MQTVPTITTLLTTMPNMEFHRFISRRTLCIQTEQCVVKTKKINFGIFSNSFSILCAQFRRRASERAVTAARCDVQIVFGCNKTRHEIQSSASEFDFSKRESNRACHNEFVRLWDAFFCHSPCAYTLINVSLCEANNFLIKAHTLMEWHDLFRMSTAAAIMQNARTHHMHAHRPLTAKSMQFQHLSCN